MKEKTLKQKIINRIKSKNLKKPTVGIDEERNKKRKKLILLILLLILFSSTIFIVFKMLNKDKYNINKNPKVNIIYIEKLIYESNVCDKKWIDNMNKTVDTLNNETYEIKHIETNNSKYKEKLDNFSALQKELSKALQELVTYIESKDKPNLELSSKDSEVLVENVKLTYKNYKNYYNTEIGGNK